VRLRAGGGGGSALVVAADKAMLWQYMVADRATPTAKSETTMAPGGCRAGRHLQFASQKLFDQNCDAFEGSCQYSTLASNFWEWQGDPDISPIVRTIAVNDVRAALSTTNAAKKVVAFHTHSIVAISTRWWSCKVVYTRERAGGR